MTVKPEEYTGPTEFVHLHNHTIFSALDGVASPGQYAAECAQRGYPAMSATEHGHMASVPDMYLAFKKQGIQYIPGCEIYYNDYEPLRRQFIEEGGKIKRLNEDDPVLASRIRRNRHLTVLCKNEQGFHNLVKLTTLAHEFGFYYYPRVWFDKLCEYKEGLIILSGCLNGPVSYELQLDINHHAKFGKIMPRVKGRDYSAAEHIKAFKSEFGDDFYIEVQMPCLQGSEDIPRDYQIFWLLVEFADKYGVKVVITNDAHYLEERDFEVQRVMMAVSQKKTIDDEDLFIVNSSEQYLKSRAQLWATFKNNKYSKRVDDRKFEEMCDNTLRIAEQCAQFKPDTNPKIPDWSQVEEGVDAGEKLRVVTARELQRRGLHKSKKKYVVDGREVTYTKQAKIELNRFIDKGFASYFLITQDLLQYGHAQGWPFGPRGSAGGSLVCFLLGIHDLDPLKWDLSFDRFMASSRGGYMLDIRM